MFATTQNPKRTLPSSVGRRTNTFVLTRPPLNWFIEAAVSSSELDTEKAAIYAEASVPKYWIILPEEKRIEIFTAPDGQVHAEHRTVECPQVAVSKMLPAFELDLATFFPR